MAHTTTTNSTRAKAGAIIARFYARLGKPAPSFMWFADPLECALACNLLELMDEVGCGSWHAGCGTRALLAFKRPAGGLVRGLLWNVLDRELRTMIQLPAELAPRGYAYWAMLWTAFWRRHELLVGPWRSRDARLALHSRGLRGPRAFMAREHSHFAGFWGGEVEGAALAASVPGTAGERLHALQRACGWWSPRERLVICSDWRPRISLDSDNALHNERGPALELIEHEAAFAWHGTRVPRAWIEQPSTVDPDPALRERDPAVRRAAVATVGWKRLIASLPTREIDVDRDPQIGVLIECELPVEGRCRFLRARCGTGRDVVLSVPRTMTTALEANAWTYGLQSNEYRLEVRT